MNAFCRSCNATIIWAHTLQGNKMIPIDALPTVDGNIVLRTDLMGHVVAHVLHVGDRRSDTEVTYTSHFATCPDAREWRHG